VVVAHNRPNPPQAAIEEIEALLRHQPLRNRRELADIRKQHGHPLQHLIPQLHIQDAVAPQEAQELMGDEAPVGAVDPRHLAVEAGVLQGNRQLGAEDLDRLQPQAAEHVAGRVVLQTHHPQHLRLPVQRPRDLSVECRRLVSAMGPCHRCRIGSGEGPGRPPRNGQQPQANSPCTASTPLADGQLHCRRTSPTTQQPGLKNSRVLRD
jgi:hypothetical protein